MLEFPPSLCSRDEPLDIDLRGIASAFPVSDFATHNGKGRQAAIQALVGQNGQFGFCDVQPSPMLRRQMEIELRGIRRASCGGNAA